MWWIMNESAGSELFDISGNFNHGTFVNMGAANWVTGRRGKALSFNGSNEYVSIDDTPALDFDRLDAFSVSAWLYPQGNAANAAWVIKQQALVSLDYRGWYIVGEVGTGGFKLIFVHRNNNQPANVIDVRSNNVIVPLNKWTQIIATYDGSSSASGVVLYVDGIEVTLITVISDNLTATTKNSEPVTIGARSDEKLPFNGIMDDVRIFNRVLSKDDVRQLYFNPYKDFDDEEDIGVSGIVSISDIGSISNLALANIKSMSGVDIENIASVSGVSN